ncbi:MAG: ABC transporter ATP-binding protein [Gammaproteobacteria bacterium]|nr:ABC transporter ATP-binding protein [Gammaproteobacteria bacterium]MBQ0839367.1 ABC transporter ATP-binding protein [Gammaproteobacteria bacterium]
MTVSIHNLQFAYGRANDNPILKIPEWSVTTGEHIFLHGPSGSGKSTLLNLLAGILAATEGSINILDQSLDRMSGRQRDKFRAHHIGFVFQQFNLIHYLSVLDNIRLANHFSGFPFRKNTDSQAKELLRALGINAALHHQPASSLSIGQQQRVAIARSLINTPELLIVDEPTSALDSQNRDAFMTLLMEIVRQHNITLIFVSHDQSLARYFSRTVSLQAINTAGGHH